MNEKEEIRAEKPPKKIRKRKVRHVSTLMRKMLILTTALMMAGAFAAGVASYIHGAQINGADTVTGITGLLETEIDKNELRDLRDEAVRISNDVGDYETDEYESKLVHIEKFQSIADSEAYKSLLLTLQRYRFSMHNIKSIYLIWYDSEHERWVYLADGNAEDAELMYPVGTMDSMSHGDFDRVDLSKSGRLKIELEEKGRLYFYGLTPWYDDTGNLLCYAGVDLDIQVAALGLLNFMLQILIVMAIIGAIITIVMIRLSQKSIRPIIEVTKAAEKYIDKGIEQAAETTDSSSEGYFSQTDGGYVYEYRELVLALQTMESGLDRYIRELGIATSEKQRVQTELSLATEIQNNTLPNIFPPYPDRKEFELYASMDPAKEVGGDFYDFFLIDDDHLALIIADVSGKGIPAALFMMASKIMLANRAMFGGTPGEILTDVNEQLCRNNAPEMFVTVWLGILEISSGKLTAANAGHEYPIISHQGKAFEILKDRHGLVLGGMEGMRYRTYEIQLQPGDIIYLYTDGVAEASDAGDNQFGTERMLEVLNTAGNRNPEDLIHTMRKQTDSFTEGAPQFDDLTQLCLCYNGTDHEEESHMKTLTLEARVDNLAKVLSFLEEHLMRLNADSKAKMQLEIALEELFVNVSNYAYENGDGYATVSVGNSGRMVTVILEDTGKPYNPLEKNDPDIALSAEDRPVGGLGIFMVKQIMDEFTYEYQDGKNVVTIRKKV